MAEQFEWTEVEKASTTGKEQLDMFQRLVDFVNARLAEIEALQTEITDITTTKLLNISCNNMSNTSSTSTDLRKN